MNTNVFPAMVQINNQEITALLEKWDSYINFLVRKKMPYYHVLPGLFDLEVDEIVQRTRIKLWFVLQNRGINNIKAYIGRIISTECIDMVRRQQKASPLPLDDDGELYQGNILMSDGTGDDPSSLFEQAESLSEYIDEIAKSILVLPCRQRHAILAALSKECRGDIHLVQAFRLYGIDLATDFQEIEKHEVQKLRASLNIARKKLYLLRRLYVY